MLKMIKAKPLLNTKDIKVVFMGTPAFAASALDALIKENYNVITVITRPDTPKGRSGKKIPSEVSVLAEKHHIPILKPESKDELVSMTERIVCDFIVVAAYGMIIPDSVLRLPKYGSVNIHGSLLPKYRGASPIAAVILNGDKYTGVTVMKMTSKMDAGDIYTSVKREILTCDTTETLAEKLAKDGAELIVTTLQKIITKEIVSTPQIENDVTYCGLLKKEDGTANWDEPAETIARKVRAYTPWPGMQTELLGRSLKLISVKIADSLVLKPGETLIDLHQLYVGTGSQALEIITLQPVGKTPMSARDFLNGIN